MAAGRIVLSSNMPARDRNDRLVSGALLYVYTNGTTTKASIYTDAALTTPLANPVVANSSGAFVSIWAEAGTTDVPVLYTLSLTGPNGESLGNPSVWDDFSPSLDYASDATAFARTLLDDATAAEARTTLGADLAANVNFTPSGPGAVTRSTAQVLDDFIRITDDGAAGTGSGDDSAEIQSVIDKVRDADRPGNILGVPGKNYRITSPLVLKRGVRLELNGATITAAYDNAPIVKLDSDAQSHSWAVRDGILIYATQQTTAHTDSACVQTSAGGVNSYMGDISNLTLQNANCGIKGPATAGSFSFLLHADNIMIVNNSGWAVDIDSGPGGNTNLNLENIFSTQSGGSNTANKGFRIRNCGGLVAKNLSVDQAKGQILFCENTFGSIDHLAFESATLNAADGDNEGYPVLLSNCSFMRIGTIYSYNSTFATNGSDMIIVRAGDSRLWVDNYILSSITQSTTGGGGVYHAQVAVSGLIRNDYFSATNAADGLPIAANLADFGTVKYITRWSGTERTTTSTFPVAADNAAALAAGLTVGMEYATATGERRVVV